MRKILSITILALLAFSGVGAQPAQEVLFRAMEDEMNRSLKGLKIDGENAPFYINYIATDLWQASIRASLGGIVENRCSPCRRTLAVQVMVGDYEVNGGAQECTGIYFDKPTTIDDNYGQIRRDLWSLGDAAYKSAAAGYRNKLSAIERAVDQQNRLPDMNRAAKEDLRDNPSGFARFDAGEWAKKIAGLSEIFRKYPELFDTYVSLSVTHTVRYLRNSEGTVARQPVAVVGLTAGASVEIPGEQVVSDRYALVAADVDGLPSSDELARSIADFAQRMRKLRTAGTVDEYYYGPVMFEGGTVCDIFTSLLLAEDALLPYRKPVDAMAGMKTLANRIDRRIVDPAFTVRNYTQRKEYGGKKLLGCYQIDGEGVRPPDELTLIDKGIFRTTLGSRFPTDIRQQSTGSMRMGTGAGRNAIAVCPGTLHVSATGGQKREAMKKQLMKSAGQEGYAYAYIVKTVGSSNLLLYRVDVKTGEETLVRRGDFDRSQITLNKMRRVMAVSAAEQQVNLHYNNSIPFSVICPESIVLEDIEINPSQARKERKFFTSKPLDGGK